MVLALGNASSRSNASPCHIVHIAQITNSCAPLDNIERPTQERPHVGHKLPTSTYNCLGHDKIARHDRLMSTLPLEDGFQFEKIYQPIIFFLRCSNKTIRVRPLLKIWPSCSIVSILSSLISGESFLP
jgi:hypothetical protein